ncbi:21490_t:CDS:1, partial [Gigaspora margarita]
MSKQKINQEYCSIYNCNKESTKFRSLTDNAFAKALTTGTLTIFIFANRATNLQYSLYGN